MSPNRMPDRANAYRGHRRTPTHSAHALLTNPACNTLRDRDERSLGIVAGRVFSVSPDCLRAPLTASPDCSRRDALPSLAPDAQLVRTRQTYTTQTDRLRENS